MRILGTGRNLISGGAAAAFFLLATGGALADGPRPYVVGVSDLQGAADWSGFYIGGKLGGAWSDLSWAQNTPSVFNTGGAVAPGSSVGFSPSSFEGGIIGGGNVMLGRWVFGVELSYSGVDLSQSKSSPFFPARDTFSTKLDWLGTIEGRLGYSVHNYLLFVKSGWAASDATITLVNNTTGATASAGGFVDGWTLGGGIEVLAWSNVVLGLEYDYVDISLNNTATCANCGAAVAPTTISGDATFSSVMVRASYLFMGED